MTENNNQGLAGLFAKIAFISGKIGAVTADKQHGQGYKYHSADAILGALNHLMAENGLACIPTAPNVRIENDVWVISYQFILCDAETGATFVADWVSAAPMRMGQNYDDKALGKAHTYAHKYFLMKLFMVSSVDTPDLDDDTSQNKPASKQQNKAKPANEAKPADINDIDGALGLTPPVTKYTGAIKVVEVKQDKKKNKGNPYLVVAGMTLFSRQPFRNLKYEDTLIDNMGIPNKSVYMPQGAEFIIEYLEEKKGNDITKTPKHMKRVDTGEIVDI